MKWFRNLLNRFFDEQGGISGFLQNQKLKKLPQELRYLRIKDGAEGKELWTIYQKSMGGTKGDKRKPRRLYPLLVENMDGNTINWKLKQRLEIGESLPPLGQKGKEAKL